MADNKNGIKRLMDEYFNDSVIDGGIPDIAEWLVKFDEQLPLTGLDCAEALDAADPLHGFRQNFHIPQHDGADSAYLCGNSLGLQPKSTAEVVQGELDKWAKTGVRGHFTGSIPWATCEELLPDLSKEIVGADDPKVEIGFSNALTVNLHLLMAAFYRPTSARNKIMIEAAAFPSDRYATASHIMHHGLDPADVLIEVTKADNVKPSTENYGILTTERIISEIDKNKDSLALVMLSGVQYLTGQLFDIKAITAHVLAINATLSDGERISIGWDLAHAAGNVPLCLHDWGVDFAAWCSYKYLNSGAGCLSGIFVHSKHAKSTMKELPRLTGWWGVPIETRFKMEQDFKPANGAPSFLCSNVNPLMVACIKPSLELFVNAGGIRMTRHKSYLITGYLELVLKKLNLTPLQSVPEGQHGVEIVTPSEPKARGCQLSLRVVCKGGGEAITMKDLEERLADAGAIVDAREPDIVRVSPAPLYNSFRDVQLFCNILKTCLE